MNQGFAIDLARHRVASGGVPYLTRLHNSILLYNPMRLTVTASTVLCGQRDHYAIALVATADCNSDAA